MDGPKREVTVTVPVPREIEERAWQRFLEADDPDPQQLKEYILDDLRVRFEFDLSEDRVDEDFLRSTA